MKIHTPSGISMFNESPKQTRPLYWVLMVAIGCLYYWSLKTTPALLEPTHLLVFTMLMLIHALLHWAGPLVAARRPWLVPYFVVQAALVFTIVFMTPSGSFSYGLYWAMAGEAAMILADLRSASLTIVGYMALSAINFGWQLGWDKLPALVAYIAPMAFFILVYALMFQRQAQARQQTQALLADLETAHRQLAEYAIQVESLTLSNERERMARELHDTLAQGLAGLILQLEAVDTHLSRGQLERAQTIIAQAMRRARSTLAEARHAIDDLRQNDVDLDIESAVRAKVEHFTGVTGIDCDLDLEIISRVPPTLAEHILKIVSEGLTNITNHAHATKVSLHLDADNDLFEMELQDDGRGFDPGAQTTGGHYGLVGMRERARLAGGTLEICSVTGKGTRLHLNVPLCERNEPT